MLRVGETRPVKDVLALPMYPELKAEEQDFILDIIKNNIN